MPKSPTKIDVNKFKPIWKLKLCANIFIKNMINPPSKEFIISLNIIFIGTIKSLHIIKIKQMQAIKVSIVVKSIPIPPILIYMMACIVL